MCGILYFDVTGLAPKAVNLVRAGADSLSHRGPDGSATEVSSCHLLAFHRLAVINPGGTAGMQPIHGPAQTSEQSLICNGEIYNYLDLAADLWVDPTTLWSDVHIMLHVLTKAQDNASTICEALERVDGEYALVCLDGDRVIAARDPWGVRPLFLARDSMDASRIIGFASEAKAIVGLPGVGLVEVFPPGHVMISQGGGRYESRSFAKPPGSLGSLGVSMLVDDAGPGKQVRQLVERAICKRLEHSDVPVGILCSGGIDSAIVTALVAADESLLKRVRVFTVTYASGHSDDAFYACLLCSQCGIQLEVVSFTLTDVMQAIEPVIRCCETYDPNTIRAAIPMYLLAKHIAQNTDVKVVLSGEGADELFAGYSYLRKAPSPEAVNLESRRLLSQLFMFDILRADRCFAAFGLEVRVPYLDLALVAFVSALPGEAKAITQQTNFVEKHLLRDAFRETVTDIGKFLHGSRIIDRPKEKLSDGCGFSYIPHLLSNLGRDSGAANLPERLAAEGKQYGRIFDGIYGRACRSLVVPRVMPEWAGEKVHLGAQIL